MNRRSKKRIGIFGGTFDPPHSGHLMIAEQARRQLRLEKVIFVPAAIPPHKRKRSRSSPRARRDMVKLAVRGNPWFSLSEVELRRKGVSYTVETLKYFRRRFPRAVLILILGSDNAAELASWKDPEAILSIATVAVYGRSSDAIRRKSSFTRIRGPRIRLSSTEIRTRVRAGRPIRWLVPEAVETYILRNRLYE